VIDKTTMGVANPVLPCGVKIYLQYNGTQVLTQVIDRGPDVPGREFDVTRALAKRLGLVGTRTIRWRFAR
jgi:rare lipoprotein A (peptidoglycan hydrolase)